MPDKEQTLEQLRQKTGYDGWQWQDKPKRGFVLEVAQVDVFALKAAFQMHLPQTSQWVHIHKEAAKHDDPHSIAGLFIDEEFGLQNMSLLIRNSFAADVRNARESLKQGIELERLWSLKDLRSDPRGVKER